MIHRNDWIGRLMSYMMSNYWKSSPFLQGHCLVWCLDHWIYTLRRSVCWHLQAVPRLTGQQATHSKKEEKAPIAMLWRTVLVSVTAVDRGTPRTRRGLEESRSTSSETGRRRNLDFCITDWPPHLSEASPDKGQVGRASPQNPLADENKEYYETEEHGDDTEPFLDRRHHTYIF